MKNGLITMMFIIAALAIANVYADTVPAQPSQEQPEALTSGPVHEAYAEPVTLDNQEGIVAPSQPPANINETPPVEKPQGGNFYWVPGYWAWDTDNNNYIWVSGCWRQAPPGTYWVPGYWYQTSGGWQWVAGFWSPVGSGEITYLPQPPVVEYAAIPVAPSPDVTWVPPCYYWSHGGYVLRAGYWLPVQENWLWTPSHYIWTPRGYVFVGGHWDYPMRYRGVLFSPVRFHHGAYFGATFSYSPSIVIDLGSVNISLFTYPRYHHYYFGDYYADSYIHIGIYPWFEFKSHHTWYDPIYEYDRCHFHKRHPDWEDRQRHDYDDRRHNVDHRPAKTYHDQEARLAHMSDKDKKSYRVAQPMKTYEKTMNERFQKLDAKKHDNVVAQSNAVEKFKDDRNRWENPNPSAGHDRGPQGEHNNTQQLGAPKTNVQQNHIDTPHSSSGQVKVPESGHNPQQLGAPAPQMNQQNHIDTPHSSSGQVRVPETHNNVQQQGTQNPTQITPQQAPAQVQQQTHSQPKVQTQQQPHVQQNVQSAQPQQHQQMNQQKQVQVQQSAPASQHVQTHRQPESVKISSPPIVSQPDHKLKMPPQPVKERGNDNNQNTSDRNQDRPNGRDSGRR